MNHRTRKIRAWMALNGVTAAQVAKANSPISNRAVHRFIAGTMSSSRLRAWFIAQGCPSGHLAATKRPTKRAARRTEA